MSPQRERELRRAQMAAAAARRAEPDAGPAGRTAIRSKPIRITLDLSPELYRELTGWADSAAIELGVPRISLAAAVRAMIRVTADQPDPVLDRLRHDRDKLARSAGHGGGDPPGTPRSAGHGGATPLAPPAVLAIGQACETNGAGHRPGDRRARSSGKDR
jgi:hypothetical protein